MPWALWSYTGNIIGPLKAHHIDIVFASFRNKLASSLVDGTFSEYESQVAEKQDVEQALYSLSSEATVEDLRNNIRIYMEATIARTKCKPIAKGPEIIWKFTIGAVIY